MAPLTPLEEKDGGIRAIAVGAHSILACSMVKLDVSAVLAPYQLEFGVRGGIEAAINVARCYICHLLPGYAMVKLDFKNGLNLVHRARMLVAVQGLVPQIYQFFNSAYSAPSSLFWSG